MTKHSKQRDAIYQNLCSRTDHPTAEDVYFAIKSEIPAISLATVYRNLAQLEAENKIIKIGSGGTARYDGNVIPHYHVHCLNCSGVSDIFINDETLNLKAAENYSGVIISHSVMFHGYCSECTKAIG